MSHSVGVRELRQHASEVLRRVEDGERLTVTVSGRDVALLVPATRRAWRRYDEVADIWASPADPTFAATRDLLDQEITDPFERDA
jgi:prevent-host-death family protein